MNPQNLQAKLVGDEDERAVSPVIGVILMVAITVILAAVIAAFVLDMGSSIGDTSPQANFNWDQSGDGANLEVTLQHKGGDELNADELSVATDGGSGATGTIDIDSSQWSSEISASDGFVISYMSGVTTNNGEITDESSGSEDVIGIWFNGDAPGDGSNNGYVIVPNSDSPDITTLEKVQLTWQSDNGDSQVITEYEV